MHNELPQFINLLFSEFSKQNINYCVLRQYFDLPEKLSGSDLDILVVPSRFKDAKATLLWAAQQCDLSLLRETAYGQVHFFHFYKKTLEGYFFLRIDLNRDQRYMGASFIEASAILKRAIKYRGFYVAHPADEVVLSLLFPLLAAGKIKAKHKERILQVTKEYPQQLEEILSTYLGPAFSQEVIACLNSDSINSVARYRSKIIRHIFLRALKQPLDFIINLSIFIRDLLLLRIFPPGCVVILCHTRNKTNKDFTRLLAQSCTNLMLGEHWLIQDRTLLLPLKSNLSSVPAFIYYSLDFLLGYFIRLRKSVRRHGIIIIDSYPREFLYRNKRLLRPFRRLLFLDLKKMEKEEQSSGNDSQVEEVSFNQLINRCMGAIIHKVGLPS